MDTSQMGYTSTAQYETIIQRHIRSGRASNKSEVIHQALALSDEAEVVISQFKREIEASFAAHGTSQARHLIWLPELARRVAVVCTVFNGGTDPVIPADAATAAVLEHFKQ